MLRDPIAETGEPRRCPSPKTALRTSRASIARKSERGRERGYPGAKGGSGVYQAIINEIPPHAVFIEAFVGSGQVTEHKRPAASTIVIDRDGAVVKRWKGRPGIIAVHGDALEWLRARKWNGNEVVYCDPPYPLDTRSSPRNYYRHEFKTHKEHAALLALLTTLPCPVLVSGYNCPLYGNALWKWRRVDYTAQTRGGPRTESLWCNFPEPFALHDYRYLGGNFREREKIKRQKLRWRRRLERMDKLQRAAMLETLAELQLAPAEKAMVQPRQKERASSTGGNGDAGPGLPRRK